MQKLTLISIALCLLCGAEARAQAVVNGGVSGTLVSVSVPAPAGTTTTILTTPKSGQFVLTQVGSALSPFPGSPLAPLGVFFGATKFGPLGTVPLQTGANTVAPVTKLTFSPGLALPAGANVQCTPIFSGTIITDCYAIGVLEK